MGLPPRASALFFAAGVLSLSVFLGGCASSARIVKFPAGIVPPTTVALMPLDNQTNSVPGALYFREQMQKQLKKKGYISMPLSDVDQALSGQFGISLGGQIEESIIGEIGRALNVDAVMTGVVEKYGATLGLPPKNEVEASFALYGTELGEPLWTYHDYTYEKIRPFTVETLGEKLIETILGKPLIRVVHRYYRKMLTRMPNGAGAYPSSGG